MDDEAGLDLADAIDLLRGQVQSAHTRANSAGLQFPIQSLTIELKVGLTRKADGKLGFKVPLVGAEFGAGAGFERETVQTVTVVLGPPVDRHGRSVPVAGLSHEKKD